MKKAIAIQTLNNFDGIAIFDIVYGIEGKIVSAFWNGSKYDKTVYSKIRYDEAGAYFIRFNAKYYLADFCEI